MVVDVRRERRPLEEHFGSAIRLSLRAVDRDEHAFGGVGGAPPQQPVPRGRGSGTRRATARARRGPSRSPCRAVEREVHREQRAERVAVGVLVRGHDEPLVARASRRDSRESAQASIGVASGLGASSSISCVIARRARPPCRRRTRDAGSASKWSSRRSSPAALLCALERLHRLRALLLGAEHAHATPCA